MLLSLKRIKTLVSRGYKVGPEIRVSVRDTPLVALADASNTTRSLVVVLDSFTAPCIGM